MAAPNAQDVCDPKEARKRRQQLGLAGDATDEEYAERWAVLVAKVQAQAPKPRLDEEAATSNS